MSILPPVVSTVPAAHLNPVAAVAAGAADRTFTVTYTDDTAIRVGTFNSWDVNVVGPNGFSQYAQFVNADTATNGTPRTATYRITAPGGTWDAADNGAYTVNLRAGQVSDTAGNWVPAGTLGSFAVNLSAPPPASAAPTARLNPVSTAAGADSTGQTFTVTYADDSAVWAASINSWDLQVTGPNGFSQLATLVKLGNAGDGPVNTATYRIPAPGGTWNASANGAYTVKMRANQVSDTAGHWVPAGTLGAFQVQAPAVAAAAAAVTTASASTAPSTLTSRFTQAVVPLLPVVDVLAAASALP